MADPCRMAVEAKWKSYEEGNCQVSRRQSLQLSDDSLYCSRLHSPLQVGPMQYRSYANLLRHLIFNSINKEKKCIVFVDVYEQVNICVPHKAVQNST